MNNTIIDINHRRDVESKYLEANARSNELEIRPKEEVAICGCFLEVLPSLKSGYGEVIEALDLLKGDPEEGAKKMNITRENLKVKRHHA